MPFVEPEEKSSSSDETTTSCALCCHEKPTSSMVSLSRCSHESCHNCMVQWVTNQESSGRTTPPICPFCRVELSEPDVLLLLGRPFQPKGSLNSTSSRPVEEEMDELTLHLLQEQTRQCTSCGAYIEKVPGGCDLMECLCGYRFCYNCGKPGGTCSCTPSHHYFWDNVLDRHAPRHAHTGATKDEETGHVLNLKNYIVRRRVQDSRARKRVEVAREQRDVDQYFLSAKWIFSPKTRSSFRILNELEERKQVQRQRALKMRRRNREEEHVGESFLSARWIFCCSTKMSASKMLEQQMQAERVKKRRAWNAKKIFIEQKDVGEIYMSARWLFVGAKATASRMLEQQIKAEELRRARTRKVNEVDAITTEIDEFLKNGRWLFKKGSSEVMSKRLSRLLEHHTRIERMRYEESLMRLWDYVTDDEDSDGGDRVSDEKENACAIRLLFLSEDEKAVEQAEIKTYGL